jgi:hypothetical protein
MPRFSAQSGAFVASETERFAQVIRAAKITDG